MFVTKNRTAAVALLAVTFVGALGACGDRTVTTTPASSGRGRPAVATTAPAPGAPVTDNVSADAATDESLDEVNRILDDVQADLSKADREATTPEGDPTA